MSLYRPFSKLFVSCVALLILGCATGPKDIPSRLSADELRMTGEKFLAADDDGQAIKFFQWALAKNPNDPFVHYDLGIAYDQRGAYPEALHHLTQAIELSPNYSDAYNALGRHYARTGKIDLAQTSFEKALANPMYQTPYLALYNLGLLFEDKGDPDSALTYYQEAINKNPKYGLAYYKAGKILEAAKKGDEARLAYGKAVEFAPNMAEAHLRYGVMSYMAGELENAFYSLNRVVKLAPNSPMAEEARQYMEQMNSIVATGGPTKNPGLPKRELINKIDIVKDRELRRPIPPPPVSEKRKSVNETARSLPAAPPEAAPAALPSGDLGQTKTPVPEVEKAREAVPEPVPLATPSRDAGQADTPVAVVGEAPQPSPDVSPASNEPVLEKSPPPAEPPLSVQEQPAGGAQVELSTSETPAGPVVTPGAGPSVTEPQIKEGASAPDPSLNEQVPLPESTETVSKSSSGQWSYIVQVASFLQKRNAEALKNKLEGKGYDAIIKTVGHQVLKSLYVVQLKPEVDQDKARSLVTRLERDGIAKPIVIKVPAE